MINFLKAAVSPKSIKVVVRFVLPAVIFIARAITSQPQRVPARTQSLIDRAAALVLEIHDSFQGKSEGAKTA